MPTQDRVWLHQENGPGVTVEYTRECREDRSIVEFEARSGDLPFQDDELTAQHEDLVILGPVRATTQWRTTHSRWTRRPM
jgi:hypothetical protein